jgi:hypothetical protein
MTLLFLCKNNKLLHIARPVVVLAANTTGGDTMDREKLLATIVAPLEYYAKALASGELDGAEAGAILELMLAGARREIEAGV